MEITNIKLNFLDNYYMFYDWLDSDNIESFNKVTVYRVTSNILNDFINYKIRVLDEAIFKKNNPAIFTDTYSYIAIEFDENGYSVHKSSLKLEDEIKLNQKIDELKLFKVIYNKLELEKKDEDLRYNLEIKKTITIELKTIMQNNNLEKLAYLYYEWFHKRENNPQKMYDQMIKKITSPLTASEKYIYEIIKKSYKLV